ncbi:MAG: YceI family protein [Myxococcales bacterium]|nr:YceI family protein [Myxococcales bacterium]
MFVRIVTVVVALLVSAGGHAAELKFNVHSFGMSRVSFTSDAMLETIVGTTSKVSGSLTIDPKKPATTVKGQIVVDAATFRTGIDMRDAHLRSAKFLDAKTHPKATFSIEKVVGRGALVPGKKLKGTVHGTLTIKGVSKTIKVPIVVAFYKWTPELKNFKVFGDLLRIKASFPIKVADYGVKVPSVLGKKVAQSVMINLNITAVQAK